MERLWNYLLYLQWRLLNRLGAKLIQQPIHSITFFFFPKIRKKKEQIEQSYSLVINDSERGVNLGFAFSHIFLTTSIIYGVVCLYMNVLINHKVKDDIKYFLIGVMVLSYLTNYWLLWRKDIYLKYFKEFENQPFSRWRYLYVILFYLGIMTFGVLSIYWTIGFNL
jgi:hypothetical protein